MGDFEWVFLGILVAGALVRLGQRHRLGARWSVFRRAVSKIGDGREGLVRLEGRVVVEAAVDSLRSPVTDVECLFYDCIVEDRRDDPPRQVRREYRGVWFQIDDGTGTALVRFSDSGPAPAIPIEFDGPPLVSCAIPTDREVDEGPQLRAALERLYVIRPVDELPRKTRAREGYILAGDHVSVVGIASFELDPGGYGYRGAPRRYVVTHGADEPLVIASARRAGPS